MPDPRLVVGVLFAVVLVVALVWDNLDSPIWHDDDDAR